MADEDVIRLADLRELANRMPDGTTLRGALRMVAWIAELRRAAQSAEDVRVVGQRIDWAAIAPVSTDADMASAPPPPEVVQPDPDPVVSAPPAAAPIVAPAPPGKRKPFATAPVEPVAARAGAEWTEAECARLLELWNAGWSIRQIAAELGRPYPATGQKLKKLRQDLPPRPPQARGRFADPALAAAIAEQSSAAGDQSPPQTDPAPLPVEAVDAGDAGAGDMAGLAAPASAEPRRDLVARLFDLSDDFAPEDDLFLVQAMRDKVAPAIITDQLGCDIGTARDRWKRICALVDCTDAGRPTDAAAEELIAALTKIADAAAGR